VLIAVCAGEDELSRMREAQVSAMLTYADVCWRMLTYADATLCAGEDELSRMREAQVSAMAHFVALSAPADVCSRMLTYAHIRV
jgi:hypothetical protein